MYSSVLVVLTKANIHVLPHPCHDSLHPHLSHLLYNAQSAHQMNWQCIT